MPRDLRQLPPRRADVPQADRLVDAAGGDDAVVVLVPVAAQDLVLVRRDRERAELRPRVEHLEGAIAGCGGEDVGVLRRPDGGVHAVGVLREGPEGGGGTGEGPQLHGVVPRGAQEAILANLVPVHRVHLVRVLLQRSQRVGLRGRGDVPDLDAAVAARAHQHRLVLLAPAAVVQPVRGVEPRHLHERRPGSAPLLQDVLHAVADDPKVLRRRDRDAALDEGGEREGIPVVLGLEAPHGDRRPEPSPARLALCGGSRIVVAQFFYGSAGGGRAGEALAS